MQMQHCSASATLQRKCNAVVQAWCCNANANLQCKCYTAMQMQRCSASLAPQCKCDAAAQAQCTGPWTTKCSTRLCTAQVQRCTGGTTAAAVPRCSCTTNSRAHGKSHVAWRRAANAPHEPPCFTAIARCKCAVPQRGAQLQAALQGRRLLPAPALRSPWLGIAVQALRPIRSATPHRCSASCQRAPGCSTAPGCVSAATSPIKCACPPPAASKKRTPQSGAER